ncbi:hypothetical protein BC940DRAFT_226833, partial [Gongronella butleri]
IIDLINNEASLTVESVTDMLCEQFRGLAITPRIVNAHMRNKCRISYKIARPDYFARNTESTTMKRQQFGGEMVHCGIEFLNECVFIDDAAFNRNMHRAKGWSEIGKPCHIKVDTKGPNVSILGAIASTSLIVI